MGALIVFMNLDGDILCTLERIGKHEMSICERLKIASKKQKNIPASTSPQNMKYLDHYITIVVNIYSPFPNKRRAMIIFSRSLTAHMA